MPIKPSCCKIYFKPTLSIFLSRPRRFGQFLLVDTLDKILRGGRELLENLWIDNSDHDWQPYPVIFVKLGVT
ncbi:MAG: AAA family ATPase [Deltaproteobacteria bacterium]|jgi:hypothetical protein|nr:AAA family ATPase [Deltaproteobacteria bacterium]